MSCRLDSDTNTDSSTPPFGFGYSPNSWSIGDYDHQYMQNETHNVEQSIPSSSTATSDEQTSAKVCSVCGDAAFIAPNHCRCKGFFRRSLWTNRKYLCRFKNDCEIRKETRNACRRCRLARCFAVGMNPDAVQMERNQLQNGNNYQALKRLMKNEPKEFSTVGVQTDICATDFKASTSALPPPAHLSYGLNNYSYRAEDLEPIRRLVHLEREAWNLRDIIDGVAIEPDGKLNVEFEVAFHRPDVVSSRYPLQFTGHRILDAKAFICGWRRGFTFFIDYISRLFDFQRLSHGDRVCLAKRRVVNVTWWTNAYHSYLNGQNGICFPNGTFHPHKSDPRAHEADSLIDKFFANLLPIFMGDLVENCRRLKLDFVEYVLLKAVIFFRDEFFLSESGLTMVREAREQYAQLLYKYISQKFENDPSEAIIRYAEILNLIPPVLYLTSKLNEKVEMNSFFKIIDFDALTQDCHNTSTLFVQPH